MMDEPTIGRGPLRDRVGPLVIVAGMGMLALALLGKGAHHPSVAEPPQPSVTVTTTPKPSKRAHSHTAEPRAKPRQTGGGGRASDGARVSAAGAPKTSPHGSGATSHRPIAAAPSAPAPGTPAEEQPDSKSCALGISVLLLNACLDLGDAP